MSSKRGDQMNSKCIYFVEGPCEVQLIKALKENPGKLIPGKVIHHNVVQDLIPRSRLLDIQPGSVVVFVFDTDVTITAHLRKNIDLVGKYCGRRTHHLDSVLSVRMVC